MGTTVVKCTIGMPGSGKSYTRTRWIMSEFIPNEEGIIYTNLPLNVEELANHFEKKGYDRQSILDRIQLIPDDELKNWKTFDNEGNPPDNPVYKPLNHKTDDIGYHDISYKYVGPWLYFQDKELGGAHIMIDEIQKFVDIRSKLNLKRLWGDWLSTIRHEGCTIEFMTQTQARLANEIKNISETTIEIIPNSEKKFPLIPIKNYDYYQLAKKFFDFDLKSSTCTEWGVASNSKKERLHVWKYRFDPRFYKYYDSYNNEEKGGSGIRKKEEHERFSKIGLLWWFTKRNIGVLLLASVGMYFFYLLMFENGFSSAIDAYKRSQKANVVELNAKKNNMSVPEYKEFLLTAKIEKKITEQYDKKIEDLKNSLLSNPSVNTDLDSESEPVEIVLPLKLNERIKLAFIAPDSDYVILSNGHKYTVGEFVEEIKITEINFKGREVKLEDNTSFTY